MAYSVVYTNAFRKRYKLLVKRGYDMSKLRETIELLIFLENGTHSDLFG